ncbi:MAG: MmcQ/YjbR family DNA-binding protein [Pseudomonas sp.]|uniref:MmcQ/YjbR family DNA-binding protein n=1 Tax=Pseudomonas sp. TaxID=306 RepID=UPI003390C4C2
MTLDDVSQFCRALPGCAERLVASPGNIQLFEVHGNQFAYYKTSDPERGRFSFRVTPERFLELTDQPGIKPARYMQRFHWITVVDVQSLPDPDLQALIQGSYRMAVERLSKKHQATLA